MGLGYWERSVTRSHALILTMALMVKRLKHGTDIIRIMMFVRSTQLLGAAAQLLLLSAASNSCIQVVDA